MLRANFFYKFFKYKKNSSTEIVQYHSKGEFDLKDQINNKIIEIDNKISENSQALIEAQIVKFRFNFSKSNNFIEKVGKNVYKTKLEDSIKWHQKQLKELYSRRRELEINLEKIQGIYWLNRIKKLFKLFFLGFFVLCSLFIFLSGFMIILYLLPLIMLISLVYLLTTRK
tara:strand:- start:576 stop:1085 length:510 start_codon:yes stop_codon:yes gene_type:complete